MAHCKNTIDAAALEVGYEEVGSSGAFAGILLKRVPDNPYSKHVPPTINFLIPALRAELNKFKGLFKL